MERRDQRTMDRDQRENISDIYYQQRSENDRIGYLSEGERESKEQTKVDGNGKGVETNDQRGFGTERAKFRER